MTLPVPNLDDRTFAQLVDQARQRAALTCPDWTDLSAHDPGVALLEVFAYLTETMLYRLNRVPEKAYVSFLNLLGVHVEAPVAASVMIELSRRSEGDEAVRIPAGTKVAVGTPVPGEPPPVFTVTDSAVLAPGASSITVAAHHCEVIDGEILGLGSGLPGQSFVVARAPITRTSEVADVVLGVEAVSGELPDGAAARQFGNRTYALWQPVTSFAGVAPDDQVFVVDRAAGRVTFAPAVDLQGQAQDTSGARVAPVALAAIPAAGRQICIWYRTGGGPSGNVAAGLLTALQTPLPLTVTNPEAAKGGRPTETIDNAVLRGPQEFFTLRRAVTARDYELLACQSSGAVARARTLTRAELWSFAGAGEAEVVLVPAVPAELRVGGRTSLELLHSQETEEARLRTHAELDLRRPLGTSCVVTWAHYKPVSVHARVVVRPEEDAEAVAGRITERLYDTINPLPAGSGAGWPFGEPLRASNLYRMLEQAEPGVLYAEDLSFVVDEAPDTAVGVVAADQYQTRCWFAGAGPVLFRSTGDVDGWEPARRFEGEQVGAIRPYPGVSRPGITPRPGLIAVATRRDDGATSGVYVTSDLGETWTDLARFDQRVTDLAWTNRDQVPVLLMATDNGLYEQALLPGVSASQVLVEPKDPDLGFYGVTAFTSPRGEPCVALVSQAEAGVYLSLAGGPWQAAGLVGEDTRAVTVQLDGPTTTLWAAIGEADPTKAGKGVFRARLFEADVRWEPLATGWTGGTCWSVRFLGTSAVAATHSAGVLRLDTAATQPTWQAIDINCGLPLRDRPRFEPVTTLATDPARDLVLAGGPKGVYLSTDRGRYYQAAGRRVVQDRVTIPETWLLCSGEHQIEVVSAMQRPQIDRLLPGMYQRAAEPGSLVAAVLDVMAELHEPDEAILDDLDAYFDPYRAPDHFLPFLARWVDLDRLLPPDAASGQPIPFASGYGCLRNLIAAGADLAQWRGTTAGLLWFLQLATGVSGFTVDEHVPGRAFHIEVCVPVAAAPYLGLVERIVAMEKPAFVTATVRVAEIATDATTPPPAAPATAAAPTSAAAAGPPAEGATP